MKKILTIFGLIFTTTSIAGNGSGVHNQLSAASHSSDLKILNDALGNGNIVIDSIKKTDGAIIVTYTDLSDDFTSIIQIPIIEKDSDLQ